MDNINTLFNPNLCKHLSLHEIRIEEHKMNVDNNNGFVINNFTA
jgi:hypothetical protein